MQIKLKKFYYFSVLIFLFLSACSGNGTTIVPTQSEETPTQFIANLEPTSTIEVEPTQENKSLFIFTNNIEDFINQSDLDKINTTATSLGYEVTISNDVALLSGRYSLVISFDLNDQVLNQLKNVEIGHMIVVGDNLVEPTLSNFTLIKASKAEQIFISGYLAALVTDDWRVGGLLPEKEFINTTASTIFKNGVLFLCGRCVPVYGPIVNFPVTATLSTPEDNERTMQALGEISSNRLNSLYIPGDYLYDDLVILLRQNRTSIFSDFNPQSGMEDWVDYSITNNLVDVLIGILNNPGPGDAAHNTIMVEYKIESHSDEIPEGRLAYLLEMIDKVQSGLVSPFAVNDEP